MSFNGKQNNKWSCFSVCVLSSDLVVDNFIKEMQHCSVFLRKTEIWFGFGF